MFNKVLLLSARPAIYHLPIVKLAAQGGRSEVKRKRLRKGDALLATGVYPYTMTSRPPSCLDFGILPDVATVQGYRVSLSKL